MTSSCRVKIAIVGYTEHKKLTPWNNPDWEIWGLNDLYLDIPEIPIERVQWFQIHDWRDRPIKDQESPMRFTEGPENPRDANHVAWMRMWSERGMPLWLQKPRPELPHARVMPLDDIFAYFEDGRGKPIKYFTNSISWMLAMAIMRLAPLENGKRAVEGAELAVTGVDMMVAGGPGSEYGWQRPSCEWLLGWARAAGIVVYVPEQSELLKTAFQYGDSSGEYFRKRVQAYRNEMSKRRGEVFGQLEQLKAAHAELSGAINAADMILRNHMPGDPGDEPYSAGRAPAPDSHKPLAPGVTYTGEPIEGVEDGAG